MKSYLLLSVAAFGLLPVVSASANTPDASSEIVVTGRKGSSDDFGGKSGIPLNKMPQSVQIVTAKAITDAGYKSMGEVLKSVPSASPGNSRVARFQSFSLKVRGFMADQMRNGVRQRYYEDVDASAISNIERVEVLKGPSSVLFGESALGGVISIITKQPTETFLAEGAVTLGSDDQKLVSFDLGGPVTDKLGFRFTGEIERSGTFVHYQDINRENLGLTFAWKPNDRVDAHLVTEYVHRETLSNPGLPVVGTVVNNGFGTVTSSAFLAEPAFSDQNARSPLVQAWVDIDLGKSWVLTPRAQYSELDTPFTQIRVTGVDTTNKRLATRNGRVGSEDDEYYIYQLDLKGKVTTGFIEHNLLFGIEHAVETADFVQYNFVSVPSIDALSPTYLTLTQKPAVTFAFKSLGDSIDNALYAQNNMRIGDRLGIVAAVRKADLHYRSEFNGFVDVLDSDVTTWQVGGTYEINPNVSLYGGYNTGYDLENVMGSRSFDGTALKPEEADQIEAGIRGQATNLRWSVSAFKIRRTNVTTSDPINTGYSVQTGEVTVKGLEFEGVWRASEKLNLAGGFALMDGEVTASNDGDLGKDWPDTPKFQANARVSYDFGNGFDVRGYANHVGERAVATASAIKLDAYTTFDWGIGYQADKWRVDLIASNVFDEVYYTPAGSHQGQSTSVYPGDPRSISLRVSRKFK